MQFIELHGNAKDITGQRFGRLVALGPVDRQVFASQAKLGWLCKCDCGKDFKTLGSSLLARRTRSCGCYNVELASERAKCNITHGLSSSSEYRAWRSMHHRCENPNAQQFKNYGGRGITVCERWKKFENFYADMGPRPSKRHSLDRYPDKNGKYELGNCRWATGKQQAGNRRTNRIVEAFGRKGPLASFLPILKHEYRRALNHIKRGKNPEQALIDAYIIRD